MIQLIDGLTMYQDFNKPITTILAPEFLITVDSQTGEQLRESFPSHKYEGSHSTSIMIRVTRNRVAISRGNPSKINRLDNLFGYTTVDDCVRAYNRILKSLDLPLFTKATKIYYLSAKENKKPIKKSNGATITEIHTTTNKRVGKGNVSQYLAGLSTQRHRNSIPHLQPNGCTVQWLSKLGKASLIHASVYDKANEINLHQLPKIKRQYGEDSPEYEYLIRVRDFCLEQGVARFENKFKSAFLRRHDLQFWGISDYSLLNQYQSDFLAIDQKLSIQEFTMLSISDELKTRKICKSTQSANATASYYYLWMHGKRFDLSSSRVRTHRARLRKVGIDIAEVCNIQKHTPVRIKYAKEIQVSTLAAPEWYRMPSHLQLVA